MAQKPGPQLPSYLKRIQALATKYNTTLTAVLVPAFAFLVYYVGVDSPLVPIAAYAALVLGVHVTSKP